MAALQLTRLLQLAAAEAVQGTAVSYTRCLANASAGRRQFSSTRVAAAAPAVQGDASGVLKGIEGIVSAQDASPKDIADAALSLTYLQAKSDRRVWGRVFEAAAAQSASFDAPSLAAFLWAATTAGVGHFKTLYDLAAPAAKLLPSATPSQQAIILEALGKAGVNDPDIFKAAAAAVSKSAASYSASDLAKMLWGAAAAGVAEPGLIKAAGAGLAAKAGEASAKSLAQAAWAYAKLGKGDAAVLDAVAKGLSSKVGADTAPQDAVAALWAFATLNSKPDQQALSKLSAVLKGAAGDLPVEQAVYGAWGLAVLQQFDKETLSALFASIGKAVAAAPDAVPIKVLGALCEAQALTLDRMGGQAPRLPDQVFHYSMDMFRLGLEATKTRSGPGGAAFRAGLAAAAARAAGARYKPEVSAAVSKMSLVTPDGLPVDCALALDDKTKVALLPVEQGAAAGEVEVMRRLLEARGFKAVPISRAAFEAQPTDAAKAKFVLEEMKDAIGGKYSALSKKLAEPFNPYE